MVKVAIPVLGKNGIEEQIGQHFGRVPFYAIFDSETKEIETIPNSSTHTGGIGYPAENLSKMGINVMICGGLGRRAIQLFEQSGIMVYIGAQGTVKDAISAWTANKLQAATDKNACAEHAFRGEGHGDKHNKNHQHDH